MIIPIDERCRIDTDEHAWRVSRARVRKGETVWEPISYHATLEQAARSLFERELRASNAVGVVEAKAEADRLLTSLSRALTPSFGLKVPAE